MHESCTVDALPACYHNCSFGVNLVRWNKKTRWHRKPLSMQRRGGGACRPKAFPELAGNHARSRRELESGKKLVNYVQAQG